MVKKKIFKKISNIKDKDNIRKYYQNISRIFFLSLILIFSFFVLPDSLHYLKENFSPNTTIVNSSKQNFDETFNETLKKKRKQKNKKKNISRTFFLEYF